MCTVEMYFAQFLYMGYLMTIVSFVRVCCAKIACYVLVTVKWMSYVSKKYIFVVIEYVLYATASNL